MRVYANSFNIFVHFQTKHSLRYFLKLAYCGSAYHGWQTQPGVATVQETIEKALSLILGTKTAVTGAGRTDTGVHAREYYLHFNTNQAPEDNLVFRLNSLLPKDIAVYECMPVRLDAHARYDAVKRTYTYTITTQKNPFLTDAAFYLQTPLHLEAMQEAADILKQYENFKCFTKSNTDVNHYLCRIDEVNWRVDGALLVFQITANRFLRNMVRAIVGTLLDIGSGKKTVANMHQIILNQNRSEAGFSVPAHGLSLVSICYPSDIFLDQTHA